MPIQPEKPTDYVSAADDEDEYDIWEAIREKGRRVGRQEWDGGGPGYSGVVDVYFYRGAFYSDNDVEAYGPFDTFEEAADAVGLFHVNEATANSWVDPDFSDRNVAALNNEAAELRHQLKQQRASE